MIRQAFFAVLFSATAAAAITAATTLRGETKEMSVAEACATASWPMIPMGCLEGANGTDIRYVSADDPDRSRGMTDRFEIAFAE